MHLHEMRDTDTHFKIDSVTRSINPITVIRGVKIQNGSD